MRIKVDSTRTDVLEVEAWTTDQPEQVLVVLRQQLEAAAVIWPQLASFRITDRIRPKSMTKEAYDRLEEASVSNDRAAQSQA